MIRVDLGIRSTPSLHISSAGIVLRVSWINAFTFDSPKQTSSLELERYAVIGFSINAMCY